MRIIVGMSGGVDSAVSALLLKRAGHEVIGVFMKNWEEKDDNGTCLSARDWEDVQAVCGRIGIAYYSVNFAKEYRERVFSHMLEEYAAGRTPNPDVLCNREIKFKAFLDFALKIGADALATGHFARLSGDGETVRLLKGVDAEKDQSYFLYMLTQPPLRKAMFPLGGMTKREVRAIAREAGLPVAEKRDSTGVCFIGERNFKRFLMGYLPANPGEIVTETGKVIGRHDGLMYYTLGQRRGLGIGGMSGEQDGRWFVLEKDLANNRLVVGQGDDSALFSRSCTAGSVTWVSGSAPDGGAFDCRAKYRYRQPDQDVHVELSGDRLLVTSKEPQRAVTPGQSLVLYRGDECLGGGIIERVNG